MSHKKLRHDGLLSIATHEPGGQVVDQHVERPGVRATEVVKAAISLVRRSGPVAIASHQTVEGISRGKPIFNFGIGQRWSYWLVEG